MQLTEQQEAEALAAYLWLKGYPFTHIPNEAGTRDKRSAKMRAIRMKRAGTSKGFPDYLIYPPGKQIAIELKSTRKGAKATKEQIEWLKVLASHGYDAAVCHGRDEAAEFIESVIEEQTNDRPTT